MERNPERIEHDHDIFVPTVEAVFPYEKLAVPFEKSIDSYKVLDEEALLKVANQTSKQSDEEDVFAPSLEGVFPYEVLASSFANAMDKYVVLDEAALLKTIEDAVAKSKLNANENEFLDVKFEDLFQIPVTEGNAYNIKMAQYMKEGRVESSGSQLEVVSVNFDYQPIEMLDLVISVPAPQPSITTTTTTNVQSPPTVTTNPQHGLPTAPAITMPDIFEVTLDTVAFTTSIGNIFTKGASFGPSGGNLVNVYFGLPIRPGSSEIRNSDVVTLTTAEGNELNFYLSTFNGHQIGDYEYILHHAVPHLLGNPLYDVIQMGGTKIFFDNFVYSLSNTYLETNIGTLTFPIIDDVPLATSQNGGTISEAAIENSGTDQSHVPALLSGTLINPPVDRFGADGGTVTSVTINGGSYGFLFGHIVVITTEGNILTVNVNTGAYTFLLSNPLHNTNNQPINQVFTYVFTDSDGSTASNTLTITIDDDIPIATEKTNTASETLCFVNGSDTATGNLISDDNGFGISLFGADGGDITAVNGVTDASDGLVDGIIHAPTTFGDIEVYVAVQSGHQIGDYIYTLDTSKTAPQNDNLITVLDTISYTITDNDGSQDSANLVVTVTLNQAPTAVDDVGTTDENTILDVLTVNGVLSNDTDPNPGDTKIVSAVNGLGTNVGNQFTLLSNALLLLNADGSYTYNPNGVFNYLAAGSQGIDSFTYTMHDAEGLSSSATVTITINGVNSAPVAVDDSNTTDANAIINVNTIVDPHNLLINDTDDVGDTHSISEVNGVAANVGNQITLASGALLTVNADGTYNYNPNHMFDSLAQGSSTTDSFTYTLQDSGGLTSTATVIITINGVNDAPTAVDDSNTTDANTMIDVNLVSDPHNLLINDTDPDVGDTLVISEVQGLAANVGVQITLASGALLTVNANGTYQYNPNGAFVSLSVGASTIDSFTYTVQDSGGLTSTATVSITINGVNEAPIAVDDSNTTHGTTVIDVNSTLDPQCLLFNDSDPDTGDTFVISEVEGQAANVGVQITLTSGALLTVNADGTYQYDSNGVFAATDIDSFTYKITDNHGLTSNAATVTINVIVPPIILDLNDDGINLIPPDESQIAFSLFGRENTTTIGWVNGQDGLLAIDLNGDKIINGLEEFTFTHPNAKTDLEALRLLYDSNVDGILDMQDEDWARFGVWQDANENGICEPGEFLSLAERGIASIDLISDQQSDVIAGNIIFGYATYQTTDGQLHQLADVGLGLF
ncbi:Ig-like domain-containing protein [Candidatus Berkiella aquae]|uniref:Tandem-95 repeat protein n=1 Tax=Candidatus Berkiella aquae TaxID=295108 RepID=A0A0Q9Z0P2_9GAMM|nr:Ig-like domain-containing protein [Candidatus Berkiella aquae]MCS5711810.1 tandem-95 repeat protein [Candidatus Berkiella aquae]